ncbi:hypothetical protein PsYK624_094270 [Phanerochaete sordida]|uniref:Uncharacterized protein n=1 Tax=Phanerochaete sordida TaxID=48140 RepID=A0A9P3LG13_9APHY|nr:hypothetical protein PsYK624_094270 [Phanerochaete sordida]
MQLGKLSTPSVAAVLDWSQTRQWSVIPVQLASRTPEDLHRLMLHDKPNPPGFSWFIPSLWRRESAVCMPSLHACALSRGRAS